MAHCVSVANGTDALELALRALGIGPGDTVATVANAGGYSTTAIRAIGAEPLYIDIDPATMNMSAADLAARLTPAVRAIIATHLYGRMADLPALLAVTGRAGSAARRRLRAGSRRRHRRKKGRKLGRACLLQLLPHQEPGSARRRRRHHHQRPASRATREIAPPIWMEQ